MKSRTKISFFLSFIWEYIHRWGNNARPCVSLRLQAFISDNIFSLYGLIQEEMNKNKKEAAENLNMLDEKQSKRKK